MKVWVDIANSAVVNILNILTSHPVYGIICAGLCSILLIKGYLKKTMGNCNCDTTLTGKTVIVTGGNSGIGKETARELARRGARVILACRSTLKGPEAVTEIIESTKSKEVIFKQLDLCSFDSVRRFAKDVLENEQRLDILINNAGIAAPKKRQVTVDGCELVIQTNHLGHFLLTNLLLDLLKKSAPSRIINVSSDAYLFGFPDWNDLQSIKYGVVQTYAKSKIANIMFTREIAKRLKGTGVTANCLHPGVVRTNFIRSQYNLKEFSIVLVRIGIFFIGKTPAKGAQTTLHLALSKDLENVTGKYFSDCKERRLWRAVKDEDAHKLWSISEELVGL